MADSEQSKHKPINSATLSTQIIMKVDEAIEERIETIDRENEDNEKRCDMKICSPSTRVSSSTSNAFAPAQIKPKGILKPPQLSLNNTNSAKPSFVLNPSRLNPFNKPQINSNTSNLGSNGSVEVKVTNIQQNGDTPKFVPLLHSDPKPTPQPAAPVVSKATTSTTKAADFVFGQNLQERVITPSSPTNVSRKEDEPTPSTSLNANGTSEMLFSSVVNVDTNNSSNSANKETTKSLSESAREYEESRGANKRKYEEVEVITGEEEETNILSLGCKLFAYDKTSGSWQERGRGTLRLNDFDGNDGRTQSRLVFRTTGSLRVILNTKIWAEMTVEQASEKSIRLTALDANGEIKVFLIMANLEDTKNLFALLQHRLQKEIFTQKRKKQHILLVESKMSAATDSGDD